MPTPGDIHQPQRCPSAEHTRHAEDCYAVDCAAVARWYIFGTSRGCYVMTVGPMHVSAGPWTLSWGLWDERGNYIACYAATKLIRSPDDFSKNALIAERAPGRQAGTLPQSQHCNSRQIQRPSMGTFQNRFINPVWAHSRVHSST